MSNRHDTDTDAGFCFSAEDLSVLPVDVVVNAFGLRPAAHDAKTAVGRLDRRRAAAMRAAAQAAAEAYDRDLADLLDAIRAADAECASDLASDVWA